MLNSELQGENLRLGGNTKPQALLEAIRGYGERIRGALGCNRLTTVLNSVQTTDLMFILLLWSHLRFTIHNPEILSWGALSVNCLPSISNCHHDSWLVLESLCSLMFEVRNEMAGSEQPIKLDRLRFINTKIL